MRGSGTGAEDERGRLREREREREERFREYGTGCVVPPTDPSLQHHSSPALFSSTCPGPTTLRTFPITEHFFFPDIFLCPPADVLDNLQLVL